MLRACSRAARRRSGVRSVRRGAVGGAVKATLCLLNSYRTESARRLSRSAAIPGCTTPKACVPAGARSVGGGYEPSALPAAKGTANSLGRRAAESLGTGLWSYQDTDMLDRRTE